MRGLRRVCGDEGNHFGCHPRWCASKMMASTLPRNQWLPSPSDRRWPDRGKLEFKPDVEGAARPSRMHSCRAPVGSLRASHRIRLARLSANMGKVNVQCLSWLTAAVFGEHRRNFSPSVRLVRIFLLPLPQGSSIFLALSGHVKLVQVRDPLIVTRAWCRHRSLCSCRRRHARRDREQAELRTTAIDVATSIFPIAVVGLAFL